MKHTKGCARPYKKNYRLSHLEKGAEYDLELTNDPMSAYLERVERMYLTTIIPRLFPNGIDRYLDFACGTGRITNIVTPFAKDAWGIDISESMLKIACNKCPNVQFVCEDITDHILESGPFDLITAFRFFGNADQELRFSALQALSKIMRANAYLIINNHRNPLSLLALAQKSFGIKHDMDLTFFKLKKLLLKFGFKIKTAYGIGFWIFRSKVIPIGEIEGGYTQMLEHIFHGQLFALLSPDFIVIAYK